MVWGTSTPSFIYQYLIFYIRVYKVIKIYKLHKNITILLYGDGSYHTLTRTAVVSRLRVTLCRSYSRYLKIFKLTHLVTIHGVINKPHTHLYKIYYKIMTTWHVHIQFYVFRKCPTFPLITLNQLYLILGPGNKGLKGKYYEKKFCHSNVPEVHLVHSASQLGTFYL